MGPQSRVKHSTTEPLRPHTYVDNPIPRNDILDYHPLGNVIFILYNIITGFPAASLKKLGEN